MINCPHCGKPLRGNPKSKVQQNITRFEQRVLGLDGLKSFHWEGPEYFPSIQEGIQATMIGAGTAVGIYVFASQALILAGHADIATRIGLLFAAVGFLAGLAYQQLNNNANRWGFRDVEKHPKQEPDRDDDRQALIGRKINANQTQLIYLDIPIRKLRKFAQELPETDYDLTYRPWVNERSLFTQDQMKKLRDAMHELRLADKNSANRYTFNMDKTAVIDRWAAGDFTHDERQFFKNGPQNAQN